MDAFHTEIAAGVGRLTLTRPEKHNAFDDRLISALTNELVALEGDTRVRVVVLAAEGSSFSAGADIDWMKRLGAASREENLKDARALAGLMRTLDNVSKPTVCAVQGAAYGGGVGLVACCDIAVATTKAKFALSEVKLGLIPSAISPYVIAAIGGRQARRYFQTAEVFGPDTAARIGLVHEVVDPENLEAKVAQIVEALLKNAPGACAAAKRLVRDVGGRPIDADIVEDTAVRIAEIRGQPEAKEGLDAFLSRRKPDWNREDMSR